MERTCVLVPKPDESGDSTNTCEEKYDGEGEKPGLNRERLEIESGIPF